MEKLSIELRRGASANIPIRIETGTLAFKSITGMSNTAPLRVTCVGHGLPEGWRVAFMNTPWDEINTAWDSMNDSALRAITVVTADTFDVVGLNSAGFTTYTSGGQIAYYPSLDLSQFSSARMDIKTKVGGTLLGSYTTANGLLQLDTVNKVVRFIPTVADTLLLKAGSWVFDMELVTAGGDVTAACSPDSTVTVLPEVTTTT
jgi:hypothetical protein